MWRQSLILNSLWAFCYAPAVSHPQVEVCDRSPEGPAIVAALSEAGFDVGTAGLLVVPQTQAHLLILAGDADGSLSVLKMLRDDGAQGDLPVILVGTPPGIEHRGPGPGLGADAILSRPVDLTLLVSEAQRLLGRPQVAPSAPPPSPPSRTVNLGPPAERSSEVIGPDSWRPPEPTMHLAGPDEPSSEADEVVADDSVVPKSVARARAPRNQSRPISRVGRVPLTGRHGTGSVPGTAPVPVSEPSIRIEDRAQLAHWLVDRLREADARIFPHGPPLVLHFAAGEEAAEDLVPAELLEGSDFRADDGWIDDPIDAFTFIGAPAVPPMVGDQSEESGLSEIEPSQVSAVVAAHSGVPTPATGFLTQQSAALPTTQSGLMLPQSGRPPSMAPSRPPSLTVVWPDGDPILGSGAPGEVREGSLGPGGSLRLLWRLAALGLDGRLELRFSGLTLSLTIRRGELHGLEGPVMERALAWLDAGSSLELSSPGSLFVPGASSPLLGASSLHEPSESVQVALERLVRSGRVSEFQRDRALRLSRIELFGALLQTSLAEFELHPIARDLHADLATRVFARPLRAHLVWAAGQYLDYETVRAWFGEGPVGVSIVPEGRAGLEQAELSEEMRALIERSDRCSLEAIVAAAPSERTVAGTVYALLAGDVLELVKIESTELDPLLRGRVELLLERAASLAANGDYFTLLGLDARASEDAVEQAYRGRVSELTGLALSALGLDDRRADRAEALDAVEEAYRVLRRPRLLQAYAQRWKRS